MKFIVLQAASLILSPQEADDMAFIINGYYKIQMKDIEDLPIFNLSKSIPRFKAPQESKGIYTHLFTVMWVHYVFCESLDRAIFLYIFMREVRLNGVRASITTVHIRKFYKM